MKTRRTPVGLTASPPSHHTQRDTWREEAEVLSKETSNLKETVTALRQYSENDTIDQLLGQASVLFFTFCVAGRRRAEVDGHSRPTVAHCLLYIS